MFKFSDIKVGDILIVDSPNGNEYKVLEAERLGDTYYFYSEDLQNKVSSHFMVHEGNERNFGLAKIVHA